MLKISASRDLATSTTDNGGHFRNRHVVDFRVFHLMHLQFLCPRGATCLEENILFTISTCLVNRVRRLVLHCHSKSVRRVCNMDNHFL